MEITAVDLLESRQLLTQPAPFYIPQDVTEAFNHANARAEAGIALFDGQIEFLVTQAGSHSPQGMASQIANTYSRFNEVAQMSTIGDPPPGEFGTPVKDRFEELVNQFSSQVSCLVTDLNTNSPRQPAVLPEHFDPGEIVTMMGIPVSFPFWVWGAEGAASVTPTSVSLTGQKSQTFEHAEPGWTDTFTQIVSWQETTTTAGTFVLDVNRSQKSPDGQTEFFYDFKYNHTEGSDALIEGIFRQKDGNWTRSVMLTAQEDEIVSATASLGFDDGSTKISVSYSDHPMNNTEQGKRWQGTAEKTIDLFDREYKGLAGFDRHENGNQSGWAAGGARFGDANWIVAGAGMRQQNGVTEHVAQVGFFLKQDVGPIGGIRANYTFSNQVWTGQAPEYLNYFVSKDKLTLYTDVSTLAGETGLIIGLEATP